MRLLQVCYFSRLNSVCSSSGPPVYLSDCMSIRLLSVYQAICLPGCLSVYQVVGLSDCLSILYLPTKLPLGLSACLSSTVYQNVCLFHHGGLSDCLSTTTGLSDSFPKESPTYGKSIYQTACLTISLSVCQPVCLSISLCLLVYLCSTMYLHKRQGFLKE